MVCPYGFGHSSKLIQINDLDSNKIYRICFCVSAFPTSESLCVLTHCCGLLYASLELCVYYFSNITYTMTNYKRSFGIILIDFLFFSLYGDFGIKVSKQDLLSHLFQLDLWSLFYLKSTQYIFHSYLIRFYGYLFIRIFTKDLFLHPLVLVPQRHSH